MVEIRHLEAVQAAIDYIEAHLDEHVSAEAVAAQVGFSEFHFHRIFVSTVGESVSAYQRRRRLSRAARQLKGTALATLQIALEAGFDSQETFTRAFKLLFGNSPGQYRKHGGFYAIDKPKLTADVIAHISGGLTMQPKFVEFPGASVVGLGGAFAHDPPHDIPHDESIPQLWKRFVAECKRDGLPLDLTYGICLENHPQIEKPPGKSFVYVAAVPKPKGTVPPDMVPIDIPKGKYAVFTHNGSIADFPHTVKYIWSTWVPENRSLYREAPDFELYDERFDPVSESGEVDVYIPVK